MRKPTMVLAALAANTRTEVYSKSGKLVNRFFFGLLSILILSTASVAINAATFTVTNNADSGSGSLRQAVLDANSAAGADTIEFAFAFQGPVLIILSTGDLAVTGPLIINGDPARSIAVHGNHNSRIFTIAENAPVTINYLNMTAGQVTNDNGGAIHTLSPLSLFNCSLYANTATGNGGAIYMGAGPQLLRNTTISGNSAGIAGGGVYADNFNSTVLIQDSTIAFNSTSGMGGGIRNAQATVTVKNSIMAQNTATQQHPDYSSSFISHGFNIIGDTTGATINNIQGTDMTNTNPNLLPLAFNGAATRTHAFLRNSAAADRGDPTRIGATDQRGAVRGTDGDRNGVRSADVGAYELQPTLFDFDGGRQADLAVTRNICVPGLAPEGCNPQLRWFTLAPNGGATEANFGLPTDIRTPGDYDGDLTTDLAVWRPSDGNFYVYGSTAGFTAFHWGLNGDIPVPAEYNGQGITEYAVYRAGTFHIFHHLTGYYIKTIGAAGDKPAVADYDGDSKTDVAVYNNGAWKIEKSTGGMLNVNFGTAGDVAVPADYDGDGKANIAVFRPSNGTWYILNADNQTFSGTPWGLGGDRPVPADYDGDGKSDIAVFRSGNWYILNSRNGYTATNFGIPSDTPVESSFIFQTL
jgi:FG-GAP-like repeat